jgi:hypothetical protein
MAEVPYENLVVGQRYLITRLAPVPGISGGRLIPYVNFKDRVLQDIPGTVIEKKVTQQGNPLVRFTLDVEEERNPVYAPMNLVRFKSLNQHSLAAIESVGKVVNEDTTARNSWMGTVLDYAGLPKKPLPRRIGPLRPNGTFGGRRRTRKSKKSKRTRRR